LELLDSSGNVLVTADPGDSLDASLIGGGVGTTYIAVRSTGQYGRVGQYTLTATPTTAGVTVNTSGPALTTSELGRSETVTLSLNARPTADVTFSFDLNDSTEASLSASQVTFTPDNWFIPQSVVVTGQSDGIDDGAAGYTLNLSPA